MCGLTGFFGREDSAALSRSMELIAHRGPDDSGQYVDIGNGVGLGHVRLSILDLSHRGHQPMVDTSESAVIVFNGEIYNYRELRKGLVASGVTLRGESDTEVILALYLVHGVSMLDRLQGMYAFAIWDVRERALFLARDGFGIKPLYYSETSEAFVFSSEIKGLLCFSSVSRDLDHDAMRNYVRHLWCPAPGTPFKNVKKLLPGEAIIVRQHKIEKRWKHYSLPLSKPSESSSVAQLSESIRARLSAAVERQMVADVEVGAFLSGGLDSTAIVAMAKRHCPTTMKCFTIDFESAMAVKEGIERDLPYAQLAARRLGVDLHVIQVGPRIAEQLPAMLWHLDEPLADFSALNVQLISKLARAHGIKVLLSGAGGDDLFSGYRRHSASRINDVIGRMPAFSGRALAAVGRRVPTSSPLLRRVAKVLGTLRGQEAEQIASYFDWTPPGLIDDLFLLPAANAAQQQPLLDALQELPEAATILQRMLYLEQRYFLPDHNLNYTDKMSMAAGVEVRVPFLDPDLVALAARVPDRYRQKGASGKWILKQAVTQLVPQEIIKRKKAGFGVPLRQWLTGPLREMMSDILSKNSISRRGLFDANMVERLVVEFEAGLGDRSYSLFSLMCIEIWCRQFIDDEDSRFRVQA